MEHNTSLEFIIPVRQTVFHNNFPTYSASVCQSTIFYRTISHAPETLDFNNKTKLFRTFLMGSWISHHITCFSKCRHIYYVRAWNAVGNLLYKMNGVWFGWQFVMLNGWEFVLSCNMYFVESPSFTKWLYVLPVATIALNVSIRMYVQFGENISFFNVLLKFLSFKVCYEYGIRQKAVYTVVIYK